MNKNESGRSMVEILAVLAIVGVLSIGGVAGYTMAMNRYQAGQYFDYAIKLASETAGGGVATHTKKFFDVEMKVIGIDNTDDELRDGDVCIEDWGRVQSDVIDIFEQRAAPYDLGDNCYRFSRRADLGE